jgi:tryptophan synthase
MEGIKAAFAQAKAEQRTPLVGYWTAGFPRNEDTVPILLGMQRGGVDVVSR